MKRTIALLFCLVSLSAVSQTSYYTAFKTELYEKRYDGSWIKTGENNPVEIPVSFSKNVIQIMAKSATTFHVDNTSQRTYDEKQFKCLSYAGYEFVNGRNCRIDFVQYYDAYYVVLSVTYEDVSPVQNLRYYLVK